MKTHKLFVGIIFLIFFISAAGQDPSVTYEWDFGDGTPISQAQNPEHVYSQPGVYTWIFKATILGETYRRTGKITVSSTATSRILLSRGSLNFGAQQGGPSTAGQSVVITNAGTGTLAWTATPSATWITATPASGAGGGTVSISVDATGLAAGTYAGAVAFSDPGAANSPQIVTVNLKVYAPGGALPPFGDFATPLDGTSGIAGAIPVTGWVLDDIGVSKVEIWRDPVLSAGEPNSLHYVGDGLFVEGARPDVEAGYPGYPKSSAAGWGYMLLTNFLPNHGNGITKLYAIATDQDGHQVTLGTKTITCDNAHAVKPFGTIDTPAQGGTASGSRFVNFGWVLTPLPKTVPFDGSTITVYVDSVLLGTLSTPPNLYNAYRADVAANFPGLNNSGGPVGAFYVNTTAYANGVHTIWWIAYDNDGKGEGIGSRYFTIANIGGSPVPSPSAQASPASELSGLSISFSPLLVKTGYDLEADFIPQYPDRDGVVRIEVPELGRVVIDLGEERSSRAVAPGRSRYEGYLRVGEGLRRLPIGSTLDPQTGRFSWMPGPGFLGSYTIWLVDQDRRTLKKIVLEIVPKHRGRP